MSISLSHFDPDAKLPPSLTISGIVMDYLDKAPPAYRTIREIVSNLFNKERIGTPKPDYFIFYQSPLVSDPRKAPLILLAEKHLDTQCINWNAKLINTIVVPESTCLGEGIRHNRPEITGAVKTRCFAELAIHPYAQNQLSLLGWDDNDQMVEEYQAEEEGTEPAMHFTDGQGNLTAFGLHSKLRVSLQVNPHFSNAQTIELLDAVDEKSGQEFLARTLMMIKAINEIFIFHEQNKKKGKIMVLAGHAHLSQTDLSNSKKSLTLFYEFLKTLPAVVLCPTTIEKDLQTHKKSMSADLLTCLCEKLAVKVVPQYILDKPLPPVLRRQFIS